VIRETPPGARRPPATAPNGEKKSNNFNSIRVKFRTLLHAGFRLLPQSEPTAPSMEVSDGGGTATKRPAGQEREGGSSAEGGRVDPLELALAAPPGLPAGAFSPPPAAAAIASGAPLVAVPIDPMLLAGVVRRLVWGGDRRRGVARLELDGAFAGMSILLTGEGRALEVELVAGPGLEGTRLAERLLARLGARGIAVRSCEVR
jgi:hypothetical protein